MDDQKEYLTKEKFEELEKELEHLKKVKRLEVAENLEYAKSLGDLSENAEYHEARDLQANVEDRISKLENLLQSAEVMSGHHQTSAAGIGSTVTIQRETEKTPAVFTLVSSEETNLAANKISIHSPLGEALLGKKKGQLFEVVTPKGAVKYKIISIK